MLVNDKSIKQIMGNLKILMQFYFL